MSERLPEGDASTSVDRYDPAVKAKAYEFFLTTSLDPVDMGITLGVPVAVIKEWVRLGGWARRKQTIEDELMKAADSKYRKFVAEHRVPTLERHLRMSEKIEAIVEAVTDRIQEDQQLADKDRMDIKELARTLDKLTKALAQATSVSARASGIAEKTIETTNTNNSNSPLQSLIIMGVRPEAIEPRKMSDLPNRGSTALPEGKTYEAEVIKQASNGPLSDQ